MEAQAANVKRERALEGIGGWLILPAIGLPLSIALGLLAIVLLVWFPSALGYGALLRAYPGYASVRWFSVLVGLPVLALACLGCYYFFTRKSDTPQLLIVLLVLNALFGIAAFIWSCAIFRFGLALVAAVRHVLVPAAAAVIWILYFLRSRRVRATFTKPSPKVFALAYRELGSYFISPMAYIVGGMFLLAAGLWFFHEIFVPGHEATLRPLFEAMAYIMVFAVPLLTMRQISEEMRSGTIETLMTAPVTDTEVILGKFLGVMGLYVVLLACTGVFLILMAAYGQPDPGVAVMGYIGMILAGAAYVAVGLFASTLTRYQLVAALVAAAILAVFVILMQLVVAYGSEPWNEIAAKFNAMTYFKDFARGMFDLRGVVFFGSAAALFLFLSVKSLESRRWR